MYKIGYGNIKAQKQIKRNVSYMMYAVIVIGTLFNFYLLTNI